MPERTWRRWQAKAKQSRPPKGPWPQPAREAARELATKHAVKHPEWGHRKIWAMTRHDVHWVSQAPVLRLLRDDGVILPSEYQGRRRQLAADRKAEYPFPVSPTANQHDAIAAIELALADYETVFGHPLVDQCTIDAETGELLPVVTIVTDNGGPFRSLNFELFIMRHPELRHVRARVRSPGQNGSRERGFGTLKYERLFLDDIPDALTLVERVEDYRIEYNEIRPHEAIAWNRPIDVHLGLADPTIANFEGEETLPTT